MYLFRKVESSGRVEGIVIFYEFLKENYLLIHKNPEDFVTGQYTKARAFITISQNILLWIFALRFQTLAWTKSNTVNIILGSPLIFFDRPEFAAQVLSLFTILLAFIGQENQNQNFNNNLTLFIFKTGSYLIIHDWKGIAPFVQLFHKFEFIETLELTERNRRIFSKKTKFFVKYCLICTYLGVYGFYMFLIIMTAVINYLRPQPYQLLSTLIWLPPTMLLIRISGALCFTSFFYVYIIVQYMCLRFRQIYLAIRLDVQG